MRALLIDDDASSPACSATTSARTACELEAVETGALGARAARARVYDVVLLDVMLPGADGFEVCRRIRPEARRADRDAHRARRRHRSHRRASSSAPTTTCRSRSTRASSSPACARSCAARARARVERAADGRGRSTSTSPAHRVTVGGQGGSAHVVRVPPPRRARPPRGGDRPARGARQRAQGGRTTTRRSTVRSTSTSAICARSSATTAREPKMIRTVRGVGYVLVRPA